MEASSWRSTELWRSPRVGPEAVGGPPVHELPVGVSTGAGAVPAFQVAAFERPDGGDLGRVAGVGHGQQEVVVGPSRRMLGASRARPRRAAIVFIAVGVLTAGRSLVQMGSNPSSRIASRSMSSTPALDARQAARAVPAAAGLRSNRRFCAAKLVDGHRLSRQRWSLNTLRRNAFRVSPTPLAWRHFHIAARAIRADLWRCRVRDAR